MSERPSRDSVRNQEERILKRYDRQGSIHWGKQNAVGRKENRGTWG